jgi:hypothetical protein
VWEYPTRSRPTTAQTVQSLRERINGPDVFVLRTPREVDEFLHKIASKS